MNLWHRIIGRQRPGAYIEFDPPLVIPPSGPREYEVGVRDNGNGTHTVCPFLDQEHLELNWRGDKERFVVFPPDVERGGVAGVRFYGFREGMALNRYAALEIAGGLRKAAEIAERMDREVYGGEWPWLKGRGAE